MKNKLCNLFILLLLPAIAFCQTATITNVTRHAMKDAGPILKNNEMQGYWTFYTREKEDRKNYSYEVLFYDNNLKKVASFNVVRPKESTLLEIVSNDNDFMMIFYEKKSLIFEVYNRAGKRTGFKKVTDISKWEMVRINQSLQDEELTNVTAHSLGTRGFVRNQFTKNEKNGYEVVAYDSTMKELWSFGSAPDSKLLEFGEVLSSSDKYVAVSVIRKTSMLAKAYDSFFILLDASNGNKLVEMPMKDKNNGDLSLINLEVDEEKNQVLLLGEYYNPGDEVLKDQSQGIYAQRIDLKGNQLGFAKYSWTNEIAKLRKASLSDQQADNDKGKRLLYIHKILITGSGDIYAVGEEYRKTVSAMGAASKVLSVGRSEAAAMQITVGNMVVLQMNNKLDLVGYKLAEKKLNRVMLPAGYAYVNPQMLAAYVKSTGGFDYQFTSADRSKSSYTIVYTDLNRKEDSGKDKADIMIGSILINEDASEVKRTPINSEARYVSYQPAKPGYIMVTEYYRKEKKLDMHLEKI